MKILLCTNDLPDMIGFRGDVVKSFLQKGYDVTVVLPNGEKQRAEVYKLPEGCKLRYVFMAPSSINPLLDAFTFLEYYKVIVSEKPDIVFCYTIKPNIYACMAASLARVKVVDMLAGLGYIFQGNSIVKRVGRWMYRHALAKADRVIVLNTSNYNMLIDNNFVPKEKVVLFSQGEGVDLSKYYYTESKFEGPSTFIMVARLLKDKGYREYVEAARIIKKEYPETTFLLLGKTAYDNPMGISRETIEQDVASGVIDYLGFTKNVPSFLKNEVVMVLPSYHEGLNRSLMEGCAMGCPLITTDIPGCRELVDEGKNGYTVPSHDAVSLAMKIRHFINLPREQKQAMSVHSRTIAETRFDVRCVIKHYDVIVADLTKNA